MYVCALDRSEMERIRLLSLKFGFVLLHGDIGSYRLEVGVIMFVWGMNEACLMEGDCTVYHVLWLGERRCMVLVYVC